MAKAPSKFSGGFKKRKSTGDPASASVTKSADGKEKGGAQKPGGRPERHIPKANARRIGQVMVDLGFINEDQLWQVIEHHKQTGERTGQAAVSLQYLTPEMLLQSLAEQQGIKTIDLSSEDFEVPPNALKTVTQQMCELYKVVPISLENNILTIAMGDPSNIAALDDLRNFLNVEDIIPMAAKLEDIEAVVGRCYQGSSESIEDIVKEMEGDIDLAATGRTGSIDLESLEELADAAPVRRLLNMVLLLAIRDKASDIHFEPFEEEFKMRYRVDGVMYEMVPPPRHLAPAIASRIKVMANLDIAERRVPQDGRIELSIGGNPVDLRVSVLPTMFGEGVVMRVLDRTVVNLDLNMIGMPNDILVKFRKLINIPHGIALVTGPTGSGKTTTLYSALTELNDISTKIITTEDPIEYDIDGIVQVPINPDIDVTFARVLRAILRHDPDIILVGEIRDFETAQITIQSSLTGHLVFSTLHTNDSVGAITRLQDMGVPSFLISATVEGVLAQRLTRKICEKCRQAFHPSRELLMELGLTPEDVIGKQFYQGRGCESCNNTGHRGRSGIFELFMINDDIREMIISGATKDKLATAGRAHGMQTLREAGLEAIFGGVTTIDEIVRETIVDEDV